MFKNVKLLTALACLATIGLIHNSEISSVVANNGPDIGIVVTEQCPEDKADTLVVYSATWCGPCVAMAPHWVTLRAQGYKVVYIDIDNPHKYDGRWEYQTPEIVDKAMETRPSVVPTIRYYNSSTDAFLKHQKVGLQSLNSIKESLWKPSSSTDSVPVR